MAGAVLLVSSVREPPKAPLVVTVSSVSATSILVGINPSPNDGEGVASYIYERSNDGGSTWIEIANTAALSIVDSGLSPSTAYTYRARAVAPSAKRSPYSNQKGTVTPATVILEAPASIQAVAASYTQLDVSWAAVSGAASYEVYVSSDNVTFSSVAVVGGLSTSLTGLLENTLRYFKVRALDAGTNPGTFSSVTSATTTKDVTAPTVPGTPSAVVQTGGVLVTWAPSTDVGSTLNKYFIRHFRGATLLETQQQDALVVTTNPDGSSSTDDNNSWLNTTGLLGDTYQVRASDSASVTNNVSAYSASGTAVNATTVPGTLIKLVDWADGTLGGRNKTGNVTIVNTPVRRNGGGTSPGSGFSMRSYIDKNDTSFGTSGLKRAEVAQLYETPPLWEPVWYGWSVFIPANFTVPDNIGPNGRRLTTWEIITQFHPSGAFTFGNPTCAINSYPNNVYANATTVQSTAPPLWINILGDDRPPGSVTTTYQTNRRFQLGLVEVNKWHDFVMKTTWDFRKLTDGGIGRVEFWHNNIKYVDFVGQNTYNEPAAGTGNIGPYMKMGMYKGWDIAANVVSDSVYVNVGTRLFYHGELAIALESSGATFATVDPVTRVGPRP